MRVPPTPPRDPFAALREDSADALARLAEGSEEVFAALREDAWVTARNMPSLDLGDWREQVICNQIDPGYDDEDTNDLARLMARETFREVEREIARRERVARIDARVPSTSDDKFTAWTAVAAEIRKTVSVPMVLDHLGYPTKRVRRDRRGRDEYAGPCPFCGGRDRFVVWGLPQSRWMCRQCSDGHAHDAITLYRNAKGFGFVETCRDLARLGGISVPDSSRHSSRDESRTRDGTNVGTNPKVAGVEFRAGQVVTR